jgi:hypothetical protein
MLETPMQTGETPVIRPGDLPPQSSATSQGDNAPTKDFTLDDIVRAISHSSSNADRVAALDDTTTFNLIDISILFQGSGRAVLDIALKEHSGAVSELRKALLNNEDLRGKIRESGLDALEIVAAHLQTDGTLVVFARHL